MKTNCKPLGVVPCYYNPPTVSRVTDPYICTARVLSYHHYLLISHYHATNLTDHTCHLTSMIYDRKCMTCVTYVETTKLSHWVRLKFRVN